ncbi:hypothetical protein ACVIGV_006077 [Rhizobium leguminosarum]
MAVVVPPKLPIRDALDIVGRIEAGSIGRVSFEHQRRLFLTRSLEGLPHFGSLPLPGRMTNLAADGSLLRSTLLTAALSACALCLASWSIDTDRSTEHTHGLFEIREEARRFISQENAKGHQQWDVLEPNLKTLVPRCAVPLETQWTPKSLGRSKLSVMVICTVAVPNSVMRRWDVHVPVERKPN